MQRSSRSQFGWDTEKITKIAIDRFAEQLGKAEAVLFWQHLDENPNAKQMLVGLYQAGCDPLTVMTLAVLYCKGEELGVTEITKRATGYSPQQLASFSERLLQAAKDIQALNEASMPGGVTLWKLIRVLGGGELLENTLARCFRPSNWTLNLRACPSFWRLIPSS